jgi:hypothetical protein
VGLRAGMSEVEKERFLILSGLELRSFGHPDRCQSRHPGSYFSLQSYLIWSMYILFRSECYASFFLSIQTYILTSCIAKHTWLPVYWNSWSQGGAWVCMRCGEDTKTLFGRKFAGSGTSGCDRWENYIRMGGAK